MEGVYKGYGLALVTSGIRKELLRLSATRLFCRKAFGFCRRLRGAKP